MLGYNTRHNKQDNGTCVVKQMCERSGFEKLWESQVLIGNCPAGNALLATSIVYSGACMHKVL